jgi:hypothetical protein
VNAREKAAREKLRKLTGSDEHGVIGARVTKRGGGIVNDVDHHTHKETKVRSIADTIKTLRGK